MKKNKFFVLLFLQTFMTSLILASSLSATIQGIQWSVLEPTYLNS